MAKTITVDEAETRLSELLDEAAAGEEIIIAKGEGKGPRARLTPLPPAGEKRPVVYGAWKGKVWIADDFDDPLPDDLLDLFEGKTGE
jgi:antitoxin (DNA-binding transcriptional repressor) of toxin-antitoxin stability system